MMSLAEIDAVLKDTLQDVDREITRIEIALAYLHEQHDRLCSKRDSLSAPRCGVNSMRWHKTKDEADFEIWREQRDRDAYQRAKSIRTQWDALGGLNRFLTGPLWQPETSTAELGYVAGSLTRDPVRLDNAFKAVSEAGVTVSFDYRKGSNAEALFGADYRAMPPNKVAAALAHPAAVAKLKADIDAVKRSDVLVLSAPAGFSAGVEFGIAYALGKKLAVLLGEKPAPVELMYGLTTEIFTNIPDLQESLRSR